MSWSKPPSEFTKTIKGDFSVAARKTTFRILRGLILVSPVDTGRFVNNWFVGLRDKDSRTTEEQDRSGAEAFRRGEIVLAFHKGFDEIWVSNNLPYAQRLNDGHSQQAAPNFLQSTVRRFADR
jgi:hypothetical protein